VAFQRWFGKQVTAAGPRGPAGFRAYAIGDVHGRLDLLDGLLGRIAADHQARGGSARPLLVFLGDLIDRGPHSRGVMERVRGGGLPGFRTVALLGNHEEVLLRLLEGEQGLLGQWLRFGGGECLRSYGGDPQALLVRPENEAVVEVRRLVPPEHRTFLEGLGDSFRFREYLFVHAGVRPGVPLDQQTGIDLRWIRQPFLSDPRNHGAMIVHGHTITPAIDERPNRIGIDTGAYRFGVLTAVAVEEDARWFLQQAGTPAKGLEPAAAPLG
jgi:serine/threonine protein phosphatase 1